MSKFNLSSVYTNDNIYSVLKLLKALIDTLDNYEFQDPIVDANGNQIPMTWFQKLYKSIHGADDGSVAVSKDANVAGSLNVDLSALINGTIRLAKNKLGLKHGADEKIYFSNVTLKYKDNTEYPGIVILYSYQYAALAIDVNNSVLHFLSSPLSAISETNTGFEITAQPFGNVKINCYDLMVLPSRVNDLESQISNKQDKLNNTNFSQIFGQYAPQQGNIDLPVVNVTFTADPVNENAYTLSGDKTVSAKTANVTFMSHTLPFTENSHRVFIPDDYDGEYYGGYLVDYNLATKKGSAEYLYLCTDAYVDNNFQKKLYRHALNVKGASYFAVFYYYCASSEPINNLQALTTYLKPTATSIYPCTCFTNNATPAPANMNAIKYVSNAWKFCLAGGTAENLGDSVQSVSDSVSAVD